MTACLGRYTHVCYLLYYTVLELFQSYMYVGSPNPMCMYVGKPLYKQYTCITLHVIHVYCTVVSDLSLPVQIANWICVHLHFTDT